MPALPPLVQVGGRPQQLQSTYGLTGVNTALAGLGETVIANELLYLDLYNERGGGAGFWYKVDADANTPVRISPYVGIALEGGSGGAVINLQLRDRCGGFSGLTAGQPVYASTTAGAVTQTAPFATVTAGVAIREVGFAVSSTEIFLTQHNPTDFIRSNSSANWAADGTLTVNHWKDVLGTNKRRPFAFQRYAASGIQPYLLRHYKLDANTGTTAVDSGNDGQSLTFGASTAAPTWTTTRPTLAGLGNTSAVQFDGSNDTLNGSDAGLPTGTSPFSFSVWVYRSTSPPTDAVVVAYGAEVTSQYRSIIINTAGTVVTSAYNSSVSGAVGAVPLTTWTHVAVTYDGTTYRIYVNGVLSGSGTQTTNTVLAGSTGFKVGNGAGSWFKGIIDDVRVYNYALPERQVYRLAQGYNEDGTSAYPTGGATTPLLVGAHQADAGEYDRLSALLATDTTTVFHNRYPRAVDAVVGVRL